MARTNVRGYRVLQASRCLHIRSFTPHRPHGWQGTANLRHPPPATRPKSCTASPKPQRFDQGKGVVVRGGAAPRQRAALSSWPVPWRRSAETPLRRQPVVAATWGRRRAGLQIYSLPPPEGDSTPSSGTRRSTRFRRCQRQARRLSHGIVGAWEEEVPAHEVWPSAPDPETLQAHFHRPLQDPISLWPFSFSPRPKS